MKARYGMFSRSHLMTDNKQGMFTEFERALAMYPYLQVWPQQHSFANLYHHHGR